MPPVSLSAVERANPPPRRKSCGCCIKAKRRCTLEVPSCQRCSQRNLDCKYPPGVVPKRVLPRAPTPQDEPVVHIAGLDDQFLDQLVSSMGSNMDTINHSLPTPSLTNTSASCYSSSISMTDLMLENSLHHEPSMANINIDMSHESLTLDNITADALTMQGMSEDSMHYYLSAPLRFPIEGRARDDFIHFAVKARLQYAVDKIIAGPRQMVLENQTPWCHPNLYEYYMPKSMQDAQASCALYMAKNRVNSQVILRSLDNRVRELGASPMPTDGLEILARTQALFLYHIMRIFDSDIRARGDAEADTHLLEESATALASHISFKDDEPSDDPDTPPADSVSLLQQHHPQSTTQPTATCTTNYSFDTPNSTTTPAPNTPVHPKHAQLGLPTTMSALSPRRAFWETWIFEESARRTWMLTFFLIQMYRLIKGNIPVECDGKLTLHTYTLSAHLWSANDALSFTTAWRSKEHFMVKNANFSKVFEQANGDDIDVFGKILITTLIGIDETKHWLRSRGSDL